MIPFSPIGKPSMQLTNCKNCAGRCGQEMSTDN